MRDDERLSEALRQRADRVGGRPLDLTDVKRTARRMRWQRRAAAGAAAAVVLAVAVPVGLSVASGGGPGGEAEVATQTPGRTDTTPSPTTPPSSTPSPTGEPIHRVTLTADVERHSGEPKVPYWFGGITTPTGSVLPTPTELRTFTRLGAGYVGIGSKATGSGDVAYFLDEKGNVVRTVPVASSSLATSADRTVVAYTTQGNQLMVATSLTGPDRQLRTLGSDPVEPVAVSGSAPCVDPESQVGSSCVVFYNQGQHAMVSDPHGIVDTVPHLVRVTDVSSRGDVAGYTEIGDASSCSAVYTRDGALRWETCDYSLGRFSADGSRIIVRPDYLDGIGDSLVGVADARTGEPLVEFRTGRDSFLNDTAWESDGTLLAMLYDDGWALMRLTPGGDFSNASTGRIAGSPEDVPVHLPLVP